MEWLQEQVVNLELIGFLELRIIPPIEFERHGMMELPGVPMVHFVRLQHLSPQL